MRSAAAYANLRKLGRPIFTTREATALWQTDRGTAGRRLRALQADGLVRRLWRGLWSLDREIDPFVIAPYLTAPLPAYVSFWSAMARHGMIEQIPRRISVASLDRTRPVATDLGAYAIHQLAPGVFGGYDGTPESGYVAIPEKAIFDTVYIRAAAGSKAFFPELVLPPEFADPEATRWLSRIEGRRLRTLVSRRLHEILRLAARG